MPGDTASTKVEERNRQLTEVESKELMKKAGIPVVETALARSRAEAVSIARSMGFPVVLKVISPDISHKSDIGGVKLDLRSARQVGNAYSEVMAAVKAKQPSARITGVSVQRMARPGVEVIIGMSKDPQFGPVLMFGLGGVLVEILKDVSFRIVPLTRRDAAEMVREIKGFPLLQGYRGAAPVRTSVLEDLLLRLSKFAQEHPEVKEIDLNPIFAYSDSAVAVDARVVLE
jgi:acetyl-CoA synthetase (ADP-forming)